MVVMPEGLSDLIVIVKHKLPGFHIQDQRIELTGLFPGQFFHLVSIGLIVKVRAWLKQILLRKYMLDLGGQKP